MAAIKPDSNNAHSLGTTTHKWSAVHAVDVQTSTLTTTGDVEIGGNLTVLGDSVQIDVSTLAVEDPLISMARNNSADLVDIGFYGKYVEGGTTKFAGLYRDASDGKFKFFKDLTAEPGTTVGAGSSLATLVCDIEGTIEGTAALAAALETARTISISGDATGSVSFDGTADVDIALTVSNGSIENGMLVNSAISFTDGSNSESIALGTQVGFVGTANEVGVIYDAGSNTFTFSLPDTINADTSGNAATATKLATARTISVSGDASGSASFDGSANADIALTIAAGAVENSMLANSSVSFTDGTSTITRALGESLSLLGSSNVSLAYNEGANSVTFDTAATISSDTSGNAATATKLETARNISVSGDATGSVSFDGSANADIALTIAAGAVENSMLANSAISFSDGTATDVTSLGQSINFVGTADEVSVSLDAGTSTFTMSLPATINADTSGNSATATKLATARNISVSGDATGTASFDGSANADIALTIAAGAVENSMLANSSLTFSDGSVSEALNLGESVLFIGTANEVTVSYNSEANTFQFGIPDTITADLNGNASTATSAAALTTARNISVSGDATGTVSFDGSANADIALTIAAGAVENSMLANSSISFSDGTATDVTSLGQSLSFVGTANEVSVSLDAGTSTFTVGLPDDVTIANDLTVQGTINGSVTGNADTASALATARTIALTGEVTGSVSFDGSSNVEISTEIALGNLFSLSDSSTTSTLEVDDSLTIQGTANEVSVALVGSTFTVGLPDSISVNAATATKLETARNISVSGDATGTASFDGSANADIALTIAAGAVENSMLANSSISFSDGTATDVTSLGQSISFVGTANEVTVELDAGTSTFTFSLPATISADLNGNASTATSAAALTTARNISVSGDATGTVSFDGSANADIALTIAAGAVENSMLANSSISFSDGTATDVTSLGQSISFVGTANEVTVELDAGTSTFTMSLPATINADTSGNAATATKLATARDLSVSGDATGTVSFDGSANADIVLTIAAGAVENSMLASSSITFTDGLATAVTSLGNTLSLVGTANEVTVDLDAGTKTFTLSLPATINADTSGNAATATKLATARNLSVSGDATGTASFDGSANADIALTIAAGAVENSMLANSGLTIAAGTNGSGSSNAVALGETLTLNGTANEVNVSVSDNAFTVGLPDDITVQGALTVVGGASCENLTVSGSILSATSATTVRFGDSLLQFGYGNSIGVDHGFFSSHSDGDYVGCAYDESASQFIMFKTDTIPSGNTVNTGAAGYSVVDLKVDGLTSNSIVNGTLTLPSTNGDDGQYLKSNGDGTTAWAAVSAPSTRPTFTVVTTTGQTIAPTIGNEYETNVMFAFLGTSQTGDVTLPAAATAGSGYSITVRNSTSENTNTITVSRSGSDTIYVAYSQQSETSQTVPWASWKRYVSDGVSKWYVLEL